MTPTLTVAIPNYNHGHFLERCIFAVMSQERLPDELIVYDDGSTDNSLEVLEGLQKRWPLLRVIPSRRNAGVLEAINTLGKEARGQWLHCLAADDMPLPGFYKLAMREVEHHPDVAAAFGGFLAVEENGDRWAETGDRWIDAGYLSPRDMLWKLFDKAPALFSLGFTTIWNRQRLVKMLGRHHDLQSYWDTFVFRCLTSQYGGLYLGGAPLVCVSVAAETFCGRARTDSQSYFTLLQQAAKTMHQRYANVFPENYLRRWEKKAAEELKIMPVAKHRFIKLATAWALRATSKKVTRFLGR